MSRKRWSNAVTREAYRLIVADWSDTTNAADDDPGTISKAWLEGVGYEQAARLLAEQLRRDLWRWYGSVDRKDDPFAWSITQAGLSMVRWVEVAERLLKRFGPPGTRRAREDADRPLLVAGRPAAGGE